MFCKRIGDGVKEEEKIDRYWINLSWGKKEVLISFKMIYCFVYNDLKNYLKVN